LNISNTHSSYVRFPLRLWKRLCQRISNIEIRVYLAYLDLTPSNKLSYEVKLPQYMFVLLVIPWLLSLRYFPIVVTIEVQWARRIQKHTKLNEELPYPNTSTNFIRHTMEQGLVGRAFKLKHCEGSIGLLLPYAENTLSQVEAKR
jgi:hypothetical protein